ncbi:MAG: diguanylate cyclase [Wenzhouxiangellaceae bacterium]
MTLPTAAALCRYLAGFVIVSVLFIAESAAQLYNFHHYGSQDGLAQTQVLEIHRDPSGYLWLGTYGGISRYNGQSFETFNTSHGLGSNTVEALATGPEGLLWAGTGSGLCAFVEAVQRFQCHADERLASAYIYDLAITGDALWVASNRGLFRVATDQVDEFGTNQGLPSRDIRSVIVDTTGMVWAGTSAGLARLDPATQALAQIELPPNAGDLVAALLDDSDGIWIGTNAGLFRYRDGRVTEPRGLPEDVRRADFGSFTLDANDQLWAATNIGVLRRTDSEFRLLTEANGLWSAVSHAIFSGYEGLVWIGHDNGLDKWIPSPFTGYRQDQGLIASFIRSLIEDDRNRIWLGSRAGLQIAPYHDGNLLLDASRRITTADGLPDNRVYSVAFESADSALIATDLGVARWHEIDGITRVFTVDDGLAANQSQALYRDSSGRIWIGTNKGTAIYENERISPVDNDALAAAYVYRIQQDEKGRLWFASREGLFIVDPGAGTTVHMVQQQGLTDETLWDLYPEPGDGMWIGSNGDGLFHVNDELEIRRFTDQDGLIDNFVWQVLVDSSGDVWAYTNQGLSRFDGERFHNFDRSDGLLHEEGGATGALEAHDGTLWFASADGLMRFDRDFTYPRFPTPRVIIERVTSDGRALDTGQALPYGSGGLDIHYAALSFRNEDQLEFRYRMLGLDDRWSTLDAYRPITFGGLGSGDYVFEVQARSPGEPWQGSAARFEFSIEAAYWETVWFWAMVLLFAAAVLWLIFRVNMRRSRQRQRELEQLVQERTKALEESNDKLKHASITDPLTGLMNRRFLTSQIGHDIAQTSRAYSGKKLNPNNDVVFMMIDLDHFKIINDTYGHATGDEVIKGYAKLIKQQLRDSDYVVRWGGEEFLVVARQSEASQCRVIAQRIIDRARQARFHNDRNQLEIRCTCSIGVSHFPFMPDDPAIFDWEAIVSIADTAGYIAKEQGRDGWVAIHGAAGIEIGDPERFVHRLKPDLEELRKSGQIHVESSFDL